MTPSRLLTAAGLAVLACSCSVEDSPPVAATTPAAAVSAAPEAQDPCTQLALSRLDGQLAEEPSAAPERSVRANEVVAQFVQRYDEVLVASGIAAARAEVAADVAAACQRPAGASVVPVEPGPS